MINFKLGKCPKCGRNAQLMFSNNPLVPQENVICFNCIRENLSYTNLEHADFFCRTYNIPFDPNLWMDFAKTYGDKVFEEYTSIQLTDNSPDKVNLYYSGSTRDLWAKANKEWEKARTFLDILNRIPAMKESYITRSRLKWGNQYTFEELIKLDSTYARTLKANNITNPLVKEAVKTLCKLQIEMDEAIRAKDAKAIKDFSSAYSTFAKQADLEKMVEETKTDDITTVAELYQYMEDQGFKFKFHDGFDRDEVDRAITDIQAANRTLILESTGLRQLLEDMARKQQQSREEEYTRQVVEDTTIQDLINFSPEDTDIAVENDDDVTNADLSDELEEDNADKPITIVNTEGDVIND